MKRWLEVSLKGLRQLYADKPKTFILRELFQNALDEAVEWIKIRISREPGWITIEVEDDAPEGFRDITHAYTLFAPTYKRNDPEKRGRFNLGEKQVLAVVAECTILTTKGGLRFDTKGRHSLRQKREAGSVVSVRFRGSRDDYAALIEECQRYLIPQPLRVTLSTSADTFPLLPRAPFLRFGVKGLLTEIANQEGNLTRTRRNTTLELHREPKPHLYEMGLPVCPIDCGEYSINVQQKVPLGVDRETVPESYLKRLYAEVLNHTHDELDADTVSSTWVRSAMSTAHVQRDAVQTVVRTRYGDSAVVATPGDRYGVDKALSEGHRIIYAGEMSKEEWENVRTHAPLPSSTSFHPDVSAAKIVTPNRAMEKVANLAEAISERCLGVRIQVLFRKWPGSVMATYGNRTLTFNVQHLGERWFTDPLAEKVLDLIIHELAHEKGMHTEHSYHACATRLGAQLVRIALHQPSWFEPFAEKRKGAV